MVFTKCIMKMVSYWIKENTKTDHEMVFGKPIMKVVNYGIHLIKKMED